MKEIGIVADNYKVEKFRIELTNKGFVDFKVFPFTKDSSTIKICILEEEINEIKKICQFVELYFKRSN